MKAAQWNGLCITLSNEDLGEARDLSEELYKSKGNWVASKHARAQTQTPFQHQLASRDTRQVLFEPRVQTLFENIASSTTRCRKPNHRHKPQVKSLKLGYNRQLFRLPRCRGIAAAFDATRNFGLKTAQGLQIACWAAERQHPTLRIHTTIIVFPPLKSRPGIKSSFQWC